MRLNSTFLRPSGAIIKDGSEIELPAGTVSKLKNRFRTDYNRMLADKIAHYKTTGEIVEPEALVRVQELGYIYEEVSGAHG